MSGITLSALAAPELACGPSTAQTAVRSQWMLRGLWRLTPNGDATRNFPVVLPVFCLFLATSLQARITQFKIESTSAPGADGYVTITGKAYGEVDPRHRLNAIIQDIELAPRNERGMVEYSTEFRILRPTLGCSGVLLYDAVNRGTAFSEFVFGRGQFGGLSVPRERGYITVWSGWQGDLKDGPGLNIDVPIATMAGQTITGMIRTEYIVNARTSTQDLSGGPFTGANHKSYPVTSFDTSQATLTRRVKEADLREVIPANKFAFADCSTAPFPGVPDSTKICLQDGFDPNFIYELLYEGRDPLVLGLGFGATRDLVSFLHHEAADDNGNPNPIAGAVRHTLAHGTSQSGRYLTTFIDLGFNQDEAGRIVFEGANPHIAAARLPLNVRFGQPGRAYGQHEEHLFPAYESPFTWNPIHDPVAGRTASLLERCRLSDTCPKNHPDRQLDGILARARLAGHYRRPRASRRGPSRQCAILSILKYTALRRGRRTGQSRNLPQAE